MAQSQVLPTLQSQAGHVTSYFTRSDDGTNGLSISVFETKEQAEASAARGRRKRRCTSRAPRCPR